MGFFQDDQEEYYDDRRRGGGIGASIGAAIGKFILIIFAFPAVAIALLHFYFLLVKGRLRLHITTLIVVIEIMILTPIIKSMHPFSNIVLSLNIFDGIDWVALLVNYLAICMILGIIGGYFLIAVKVYQFKNKPAILFMDGWTYQFSYRTTPWEIFKKKYLIKKLTEGAYYGPDFAPLGVLEEKEAIQVPEMDITNESIKPVETKIVGRDYKEAMKHTIITGETGSGKTVSMLSFMYNDILNGYPLIVVDFKKSADVLFFLSSWAKEFNRPFYYFSNGDTSDEGNPFYESKATYDPFSTGDQNARTENIISLRKWDTASDVYKNRSQILVTSISYALLTVDRQDVPGIPWSKGGLHQTLAALDLVNMRDLILALEKKFQRKKAEGNPVTQTDEYRLKVLADTYSMIVNKSKDGNALREQLEGLKLICNKLIMSSYGNWLARNPNAPHIDLLDLMISDDGPIVLFGFSENEEQEFATAIGTIVMKDLQRAANIKNEMDNDMPCGVYIDEFQTLNPADMTGLLEKVRSARMFCTLSSQSLEQISVKSEKDGEATLKAILDTCGNYLFHSGASQDTAERMSKILGETKHVSRGIMSETSSSIFDFNLFNSRKVRTQKQSEINWVLPPSEFQNLSKPSKENGFKSEAYFISAIKSVEGRNKETSVFGAQRVHVIAQKEIVNGIDPETRAYLKNLAEVRHNKQVGINEELLSKIETPANLIEDDAVNEVIRQNDWEIEEIGSQGDFSEGFSPIQGGKPEARRTSPVASDEVSNPIRPKVGFGGGARKEATPVRAETPQKTKATESTSKPTGGFGGFSLPSLDETPIKETSKPSVPSTQPKEEFRSQLLPDMDSKPKPQAKPKKKANPRVINPKDIKKAPRSRD